MVMTAEESRRYRAAHRDRILAQEKARRANETPERRAHRLALKRANWKKHYKPRPRKASRLTADERAANAYALKREWYERNPQRVAAYRAKYNAKRRASCIPKSMPKPSLTAEERKERKRLSRYKYRLAHYQQSLMNERERHKRCRDKGRKRMYLPKYSTRITEYIENPAHARHLLMRNVGQMGDRCVKWQHAWSSGLVTKGGASW